MKKNIYILLLLILAISFNGCSRVHRPYKEVQRGIIVYQISYNKASRLIYQSIKEVFPSLRVKKTDTKDGYFVDYKFMNDKQRYTIKLKKFRGNVDDKFIEGFSFEIFSKGTRFISAESRKKLLDNAMDKFKSTSKGIIIQHAIPIRLKSAITKSFINQNITPIKNCYTQKTNQISTTTNVNKMPKTQMKIQKDTLETKLQRALILYKSGLINNNEYYDMRKEIIIKN